MWSCAVDRKLVKVVQKTSDKFKELNLWCTDEIPGQGDLS